MPRRTRRGGGARRHRHGLLTHLLHDARGQVGGRRGGRVTDGGLKRQKVVINALTFGAGAQMCAQCLHLLRRQFAVEQLADLLLVMFTGAHPSAPPFVCFDAYRSGRFPSASRKSQSRRRARNRRDFTVLNLKVQHLADLGIGQAVELAQDEDLAGIVRQAVEPARDGAAHFAAGQLLFRADALVGGEVELRLLVVVLGGGERHGRVPPAAAQEVDAHVRRQPVEPDGELALAAERAQRPIGAQEHLLRHVSGVLLVADGAQGEVIHLFLVGDDQRLKGVGVPGAHLSDDAPFLVPVHGFLAFLRSVPQVALDGARDAPQIVERLDVHDLLLVDIGVRHTAQIPAKLAARLEARQPFALDLGGKFDLMQCRLDPLAQRRQRRLRLVYDGGVAAREQPRVAEAAAADHCQIGAGVAQDVRRVCAGKKCRRWR